MGSVISQIRRVIAIAQSYYRQSKSFGRNYTVIDAVQLGSYGYAQACCNVRTRQLRAVKAMDVWDDIEEIELLNRMNKMEDIHKDLIHENIVRFYKSFQEEERRLMCYELVDGRALFDGLQDDGDYSTNHVRHYMSHILSAVEYCHKNNIIHRSLTPERFMLVSATSTVKLLNLYTATRLNDGELNEEYDIAYHNYCAPEVNYSRPYGKPADLFACGLILYNLLSGIHLYQRNHPSLDVALHGEYGFGRVEWDGVVQDGKDLAVAMLQTSQDDRITAIDALRHPFFTADEQISHEKPSVPEKLYNIFAEERLFALIHRRNTYDSIRFLQIA